jgi:hypothetical protein
MRTAMLLPLMLTSTVLAAPPVQESVTTVLGPKAYHDGDVIEILDVSSTSPKLEPGDSVTVKGRVRLDSKDSANLCFYLTQTEGDGLEESEPGQSLSVSRGLREFELKMTIKHRGVLHLSLYDERSRKPFGGTYFGTADQMKQIADWDLGYYFAR